MRTRTRLSVICLCTVLLSGARWTSTLDTVTAVPAVTVTAATGRQAGGADDRPWQLPVQPTTVIRPFEPPAVEWSRGHRGVDLAAAPGAQVRAPAQGTVAFAGVIAGRPVLVLRHSSGLRTTYEPVVASVRVGEWVSANERIGQLAKTGLGHCGWQSCLHWGLLLAEPGQVERYLDPLLMLRLSAPVLLPMGTATGANPVARTLL